MEVLWKYIRGRFDLVVVEVGGGDVLEGFLETETFRIWPQGKVRGREAGRMEREAKKNEGARDRRALKREVMEQICILQRTL